MSHCAALDRRTIGGAFSKPNIFCQCWILVAASARPLLLLPEFSRFFGSIETAHTVWVITECNLIISVSSLNDNLERASSTLRLCRTIGRCARLKRVGRHMNICALRAYAVLCCVNGKHYFPLSNDLKLTSYENETWMAREATMRGTITRFVQVTKVVVSGKRPMYGML